MDCPICEGEAQDLRVVETVPYFKCSACGSLFAHPDFLAEVEAGTARKYESDYWESELKAARERSFGSGIARMAEVIRFSRIPMTRLVDIGSGPGFLLDALQELVPSVGARVFGIELFPPAEPNRTRHPNYRIGSIADLEGQFDGGVCIEVIEHLTPNILRGMIAQLAKKSTPGALYFFNSAQPSFVEAVDPQYLDPYRRGHVVSWSIPGARRIFKPAGFNVIELPGRDWAFLAEFGSPRAIDIDTLWTWLWRPIAGNAAIASNDRFGSLFEAIGLESARCYLEAATAVSRTQWALSLQRELDQSRRRGA